LKTFLFDLDGTLVDTAPGTIAGCLAALEALGRSAPSRAEVMVAMGPSIRGAFQTLLGSDDDVEEAVRLYRAYIATHGLFDGDVYAGIPEALAEARSHCDRMFVCTAKSTHFATLTLNHYGLSGFFDGVYGAELDGRFADKGDLMAHMIAREGFEPGSACLVGDRVHDVVAARRHGTASVGVTWGYAAIGELEAANASVLCSSPAHLSQAIESVFGTLREF